MTPTDYRVPQRTLWADPGFEKARKSHRAYAQAKFAKLSGSNKVLVGREDADIALISVQSLTQSVEHDQAMPVSSPGPKADIVRRAEEAIESIRV